jgi:hypothetical protein
MEAQDKLSEDFYQPALVELKIRNKQQVLFILGETEHEFRQGKECISSTLSLIMILD